MDWSTYKFRIREIILHAEGDSKTAIEQKSKVPLQRESVCVCEREREKKEGRKSSIEKRRGSASSPPRKAKNNICLFVTILGS